MQTGPPKLVIQWASSDGFGASCGSKEATVIIATSVAEGAPAAVTKVDQREGGSISC